VALLINGETVEAALLDREFQAVKAYHSNLGGVSCCERDAEFRAMARENVIARVLLDQEARRTAPPPTPEEVAQAFVQLVEEQGGREQFEARFGKGEEVERNTHQEVSVRLGIQNLLDRVCGPDPEPTEADLEAYYRAHLDRYLTIEQVRASHILKSPTRGEDRPRAYEELRALRERLLDGGDFEAEARLHSDKAKEAAPAGEAAPGDGIDLGFFARGEMMMEVELMAFSMRVGEISPVFGTPFGFHLIKLTDRRPAVPRPLAEIRQEVRAHLLEERRERKARAFLDELRARAAIVDDESTTP
jgi:hypothetical protein